MKYLLGLLLFISVSASAQYSPTAAKTRFVNGIGLGTKDTSTMNAADTAAMIVGRDSSVYFRYKGYWKPLAYAPSTGVGTVKSVGVSMPSAFTVTNSPITTSGTIAITGAGTASQYIRGDGQLATYSNGGGGGGSSVNYYLNGGTAASVSTYYQMSNTAVIGTGVTFSTGTNGLISQFLTDAGNPNSLTIPAGAWTFQLYFSASSAGGTPTYYVELYKYSVGGTFTLIASNSSIPDGITSGTATELYVSNLPVPATTLLATDRLAVRVYVATSGRTITMYTQDSHLCKITTTFSGGISALNGLTANTQYFATGTSGTDFAISSLTDTHTFNLPTASATNRGALSSANWSTFNGKIGPGDTASMLSPYARAYAYVPYVGATTNVDLGSNTFTSGKITSNGNINDFFNLGIRNINSGTSASTNFQLGNNVSANAGGLALFSSTYISGSGFSSQYKADGIYIYSNRIGGITLNSENNNSNIYLSTNSTLSLKIDSIQRVLIPNLSTAGIVTNTSAGLLGTSNGTGFIKMSGGAVSYDNNTYLPSSAISGTTNYIPKFTSSSAIGNSAITDDGTTVTLNSRALSGTSATFSNNVDIATSTGTNLTYSLSPSGWNGAKFRYGVPTSGNAAILSYNWNGTTRDYSGYGSSVIGLTDGQITLGIGNGANPTTVLTLASTGAASFSSRVNVNGATDDGSTALNVTGATKLAGLVTFNGSSTGINTYNILNRNALGTEQGFFWYTNNVQKWFLGQRSFNSEDGFSIYSAALGGNHTYFAPDGSLTIGPGYHTGTGALYAGSAIIASLAGTGSRIVVADASGTLSATTAAATSGTYTPTITLVSNAASSTARVCQYMRVGSVVTVSGYVTVTATTPAVSSRIYMSLPISSSFTSTAQAGGAGGVPGGANIGTVIFANSTATTVSMDFLPVAGATDYWFSYTYQIL